MARRVPTAALHSWAERTTHPSFSHKQATFGVCNYETRCSGLALFDHSVDKFSVDLKELRRRLAEAPYDAAVLKVSNNTVTHFTAFKRFVEHIATVAPLAPLARDVQSTPLYAQPGDSFSGDAAQVRTLKTRADALYQSAVSLRDALVELLPAVQPESIVVTIPGGKDLLFVTETLDHLRKALAQFVSEKGIEGRLEVIRWETGSLLVVIFLGTVAAVTAVARALRAAAVAYQEMQKGRATSQHVELLKEHVRESKIKNDLATVIAEAQTKFIKATVDREAKAVELEVFAASENERLERIKYSVRTLAELFEKGATISPALDMPKEQRSQFPDVDNLLAAIPPIKQIGNSDKPESDNGATTDNASGDTKQQT